jgi:Fe-S cluster assembly scaffold protein SufB
MTPGSAGFSLPSPTDEDWRYVDCRPLAEVPSTTASALPGEACAGDAFPAPTDATHAWALAPGTARRWRATADASITDTGGCWALRLDIPAGARVQLAVTRQPAAGRSASWIHVVLGRGASLVVHDTTIGQAGVQLSAISGTVAQDAAATLRVVQHGGSLQRHLLALSLDGPGASGAMTVAADPRGEHQAHVLTRVVHAVGGTTSKQLIKAVLRDRARTSFDGLVTMLKGADGSAAEQRDHNLVLSPLARADTRPQLDIRADEVQASHGATIGALDAEELLYLRARGLPDSDARELLTEAFLAETLP